MTFNSSECLSQKMKMLQRLTQKLSGSYKAHGLKELRKVMDIRKNNTISVVLTKKTKN